MYNSRSNHYKKQVLQPEHEHAEEPSLNVDPDEDQQPEEPATSRERTPLPPPKRPAKRRRNPDPEPEEEVGNQVPNSLYKRAVYDDPETLRYIKKQTWSRIPDVVCKETRNIMTVHYQETLQSVAGSTENNVSADLEQKLRLIARGINQNIKTLLVPGLMDKKILDHSAADLKDALLEKIKAEKRQLAYDSLLLRKQQEKQDEKLLEAEKINKQLKEIQAKWSNTPIQATDKFQDYAQCLIVEPSSKTFEQ